MLKNIKYSKNICRFLFIIFLFAYKNNASFMKSIEKSKKDFGALKDKASKVKDAANKKKDAVKGKFDEAKGKFDEAKGKFDEAKGKVDEFKGKFDEAKGKVDEVKGKFDEAKGKVDEVKGKFDEAKGKFDEAKGKFDEAKGKFDEAKGKFDEAKEKVSNFKKDENNSSNEKKNSDNIFDNNYDNQNNADLYNNSNNSENNFQKEKMKDDERYFIISADVITENSGFFNFGISTVSPKQSKESFKKIVLGNKVLLIFFIWMLFTLFLSICVIFYYHIKKNYKSFIIAILFSVCYSLIFLNSIFIVVQNHLYVDIIKTLLHNLILCCIFASLGGFIGIFVVQEIRSRKRLP